MSHHSQSTSQPRVNPLGLSPLGPPIEVFHLNDVNTRKGLFTRYDYITDKKIKIQWSVELWKDHDLRKVRTSGMRHCV